MQPPNTIINNEPKVAIEPSSGGPPPQRVTILADSEEAHPQEYKHTADASYGRSVLRGHKCDKH